MRPSLKKIPDNMQFQYLSAYRNINQIRDKLKNFELENEEDQKTLSKLMKDYIRYFSILSTINKDIKKNPNLLFKNKL